MGKTKLLSAILTLSMLLIAGHSKSASAMDVTLAWDANRETDLVGYKIYYGHTSGGPYNGFGSSNGASPLVVPVSSLSNPSSPEFTIHGLPDGTYYFAATAFDADGFESGYSNEVSAQGANPASPASTNVVPVLSSLEVNGQSGAPAVQASGGLVDIRIVASDDKMVSQYLILDGQSNPIGQTFVSIPGGARQNPIFTVNGFALNGTGNSHTIYAWVKDDQGVLSAAAMKMNVMLEGAPTVVGFPSINYDDGSITITYSENNMKNATIAGNYSLNNGLLLSGNGMDMSGTNRVFRMPLNPGTLQHNIIYTMQISNAVTDATGNAVTTTSVRINDDDNDGMADDWEKQWFGSITAKDGTSDTDGDNMTDGSEYNYARSNPGWGANRWSLSPLSQDSDGDGIGDTYEALNGLNPVGSSDWNLDSDNDGWSNYEEYINGTAANDPNSHPQNLAWLESIPVNNAGIPPSQERIPNNAAFAVRMESRNGIDMTDPDAVTFSVSDGSSTYTHKLNDLNGTGSQILRPVPLDADGNMAHNLWVVYYRSAETARANSYPYDATVEVTVSAKDVNGEVLEPLTSHFKVQGEEKANQAQMEAPALSTKPDKGSSSKKKSSVDSGVLQGASITYDNNLMQDIGLEPYIGPLEEIPPLGVAETAGESVNLLPPAVFPNGVTVTIPCPDSQEVSGLSVFYYDGEKWVLACDSAGNVTHAGEGWMVPGSRINHDYNKETETPACIEIQVYHFSAAVAANVPASTVEGSGGSGGSCFISALGGK